MFNAGSGFSGASDGEVRCCSSPIMAGVGVGVAFGGRGGDSAAAEWGQMAARRAGGAHRIVERRLSLAHSAVAFSVAGNQLPRRPLREWAQLWRSLPGPEIVVPAPIKRS